MQLSTRKLVLLLGAIALIGVLGTYTVLALILPANYPDPLIINVREPSITLNGLRIVQFPPIDVEPGHNFQFVAVTTNNNGPFDAQLVINSNSSAWTNVDGTTNFGLRMHLNSTLYCPINVCPGNVYSFRAQRGINVVYGLVEIGPLAPIETFMLTGTLQRA